MFLDLIDINWILGANLIIILIGFMYLLETDIAENRAREECDDASDPRISYRHYDLYRKRS